MRIVNRIIKRKLLVLGLLATMLTANAQNKSYISEYKTVCTQLSEQYGIPASVILAVAIVESAAGKGTAATKLNNHFGMVGRNNLKAAKKGYHSRYKQYDNDKESFMDFCRVISNKDFYSRLKDNPDTREWIKAISHAGYSEQPIIWEKRILNTISTNKL